MLKNIVVVAFVSLALCPTALADNFIASYEQALSNAQARLAEALHALRRPCAEVLVHR